MDINDRSGTWFTVSKKGCKQGKKVKSSLCFTKHYVKKTHGGLGVKIHVLLTSELVRGIQSALCPDCFIPGETALRYPLDRRLGGPQKRSGRRGEEKNLAPTETLNSDPSAVQPVASRYTDCAIPVFVVCQEKRANQSVEFVPQSWNHLPMRLCSV
jgi:hypothetical protein